MARMTAQTNRFDPYRTFRFKVKWDNQYVAGLSKMGALKRTTEMVEFREAGENIVPRKLPGKTSYTGRDARSRHHLRHARLKTGPTW